MAKISRSPWILHYDGTPATQAAIECGFNDYSGFYRQFKKMFHKAPSALVK